VREYPLAVLRRPHRHGAAGDVPLQPRTIRENLAFGAPHADAEDLLEAAEAAHIRREFEEFPQGFETMVGERGVTLSGGQEPARRDWRGRCCGGRRSSSLTDALASVDTYTEERILGGLRNYTANTTTIFHFASVCRRCATPTVYRRA